jgi:hypothetical protein
MLRYLPLLLLTLSAVVLPGSSLGAPPVKSAPRTDIRTPVPPKVLRGPLDLRLLQAQRPGAVTHSPLTSGDVEALQDPNGFTALEFASSPAWLQVVADRPRAVEQIDLAFEGAGTREWTLHAAANLADMQARKGSYRRICGPRSMTGDADQLVLTKPEVFRVFRLELRADPGASLRLTGCSLWTAQSLARITLDSFVTDVAVNGVLPLRALATFDGGARQNLTPDVTWEISPPSRGSVDAFSRFAPVEAGPVSIVAVDGPIRSAPLKLEVSPSGKPDWDITFIERQPRFPLDGDARLTVGQSVRWFAHVKNYGSADSPPVPIEWKVDGKTVVRTGLTKLGRFNQSEAILTLKWDGGRHQVELIIDPDNQFEETCEGNNRLTFFTDAHAVGFWVEDSVVRHFHRHQRDLNVGGNSWEDWAQRQVASWNEQLAARHAGGPRAPETWRLDRIIVVADGMLPMAGGSAHDDPDRRDLTVNLTCGFPAADLRGPRFQRTNAPTADNPFFRDAALFKAVSRAKLPTTMSSSGDGK